MQKTFTIAKRELTCLFYSPIGYLVLGLFGLGVSWLFFRSFGPGKAAWLRDTFDWLIWLLILLTPAISMRSISEELSSGTIEPLMTAPVSDLQVIMGKWLGAMGFFILLLTPVLILALVLEWTSNPDWGPIFTGLLGLVLVGGLYMAIGVFASSITENQIIAFIVTVFIICVLTLATYFLGRESSFPTGVRQALNYININARYENFSKGLIEIGSVVYLGSGITLFLFLAVKLLESKRWR